MSFSQGYHPWSLAVTGSQNAIVRCHPYHKLVARGDTSLTTNAREKAMYTPALKLGKDTPR
jgi:hypothetical protein